MRVVHLSDTHLGFRQLNRVDEAGRNVREQDVARAFTAAIDRAIALAPAAVIHSGDLFDSHHPSAAALGTALDGLARLRAARIPIILIAGNHETPRATAAEHIFGVLERFGEGVHAIHAAPETVRVGGLAVHGIPYDNDLARMADAIRAARPDTDAEASVLVAHVGLAGLGGVVGPEASLAISGEALAGAHGFSYVALGHLHKFAPVADNAAYAGSTERLSWADDAPVKGLVEVDLARAPTDREYLRRHAVPARAQLELEPVDASEVDDLTAAIVARAEDVGVDALRGAIARLWVRNVTAADWNAVDHAAIAAAYAACLHFERRAEPRGSLAGARAADAVAVPALREFLLRWPGAQARGVDPEDFVARAEGFVALADEELAT
ncbi:MAG TPA: exonuclease SbcCD subunit D [Baekduia sp.]|uniref:metallophosphoesterase family protein n=1 Tax=Baekduia sp. TaxID=2600305 RepID=UPI002D799699|nr:exonuclease SbcCD subunit D [Baekduia sp.]HET6508961.1 exonuclease SbcCD subunit D [Baekduia sp.]